MALARTGAKSRTKLRIEGIAGKKLKGTGVTGQAVTGQQSLDRLRTRSRSPWGKTSNSVFSFFFFYGSTLDLGEFKLIGPSSKTF